MKRQKVYYLLGKEPYWYNYFIIEHGKVWKVDVVLRKFSEAGNVYRIEKQRALKKEEALCILAQVANGTNPEREIWATDE